MSPLRLLLSLILCLAVPAQAWAAIRPAGHCDMGLAIAEAMAADASAHDQAMQDCPHGADCCQDASAASHDGKPCKPGYDCQRVAVFAIGLSCDAPRADLQAALNAGPSTGSEGHQAFTHWRPPRQLLTPP